ERRGDGQLVARVDLEVGGQRGGRGRPGGGAQELVDGGELRADGGGLAARGRLVGGGDRRAPTRQFGVGLLHSGGGGHALLLERRDLALQRRRALGLEPLELGLER